MRKIRLIFLWTFGGIGLAMMLAGLIMGLHYERMTEGMRSVTGTVMGYRGSRPVVVFEMDGRSYQVTGFSTDDLPALGSDYPLMVDENAPDTHYMDETLKMMTYLFTGMGALFIGVGWAIHWGLSLGQRRREDLLTYGQRVKGVVVEVRANPTVKVNRRSPLQAVVKCVHPLTGEEITLRSQNLWECPVGVGDGVDVLFDPMDEKKYAVDVTDEAVDA